jgi:predicted esterase
MIERNIPVKTHGRHLVIPAEPGGPAPVIVGFHGYAERAETQLDRLRAIPGTESWVKVSIQGLHRFYDRRTGEVVASWMTRQDRELAITDNIAYVAETAESVSAAWMTKPPLIFAGFSQGVAMAFRAATTASVQPVGVIAVGGDIPPEIDSYGLGRLSRVLLCRGESDEWYSAEQFAGDQQRLIASGVDVRGFEYPGAHEWSRDVGKAAGIFLAEIKTSRIPAAG